MGEPKRVDRTVAVTFAIDGIVGREVYEFPNELAGATQTLRAVCRLEDEILAHPDADFETSVGGCFIDDERVRLLDVEVV